MRLVSTRLVPGILVIVTLLATAFAVVGPSSAYAATFGVTNCDDAGVGSLRAAIAAANADASVPHVITFALNPACALITLTSGQLTLERDMTIQGPGADTLAISGNQETRVFSINSGVTATISGLTITLGAEVDGGGAVANWGTLTIKTSIISGSFAGGNGGGAVFNGPGGTLTVTDSTITSNTTLFGAPGGGITNGGTLIVMDSTISNNMAIIGGSGGGVYNTATGSATMTDSTISGNIASRETFLAGESDGGFGGGILNMGVLDVTGSTFSGNSALRGGAIANVTNSGTATIVNSSLSGNTAKRAAGGLVGAVGGAVFSEGGTTTISSSTISANNSEQGGGVYQSPTGQTTLTRSIVAGNQASAVGPDAMASTVLIDGGDNLLGVSDIFSPGIVAGTNGNLAGTTASPLDPLLGPLADNGGPTQTRALLVGSPAIDHIDSTLCAGETDQRGVNRPQGTGCDIGAFETVDLAPADATISINAGATWTNNRQVSLTLAATDVVGITAYRLAESEAGLTGADPVPVDPGQTSFNATVAFTLSAGDAASRQVWFSACDVASQCSTASATIGLDTSSPVISGSRTPPANSSGWNNTSVTVSFTCAEAGVVQSGIITNTVAGTTVAVEGIGQSVSNSGTCVDQAGNVAAPMTVSGINIDLTPPSIVTTDISVPATGPGGATVSYPSPVVSDTTSGVGTPTCTPPSGSLFPISTTTVMCSVTNAAGLTASASFTVTVTDSLAPSITTPANITVNATSPSGSVVPYPTPTADDNQPGVTISCVPPSGSTFPIGITTVMCTATDAAGNTATASFSVTVIGADDLLVQLRMDTINLVSNTTAERALVAAIDQARQAAASGNTWGVYTALLKYVVQLDMYAARGMVSPATAQLLVAEARLVFNAIW